MSLAQGLQNGKVSGKAVALSTDRGVAAGSRRRRFGLSGPASDACREVESVTSGLQSQSEPRQPKAGDAEVARFLGVLSDSLGTHGHDGSGDSDPALTRA